MNAQTGIFALYSYRKCSKTLWILTTLWKLAAAVAGKKRINKWWGERKIKVNLDGEMKWELC